MADQRRATSESHTNVPAPSRASSRETRAAAGWECAEIGTFRRLLPPGRRPFSWLSPVPLLQARNDPLARVLGDPTDAQRQHWVDEMLAAGDGELTFRANTSGDGANGDVAFLVLGDTGEGDASQYCVVPGLLEKARDTAFMAIASDVIYPAGGINEYETKFFHPYQHYPAPIYAVPGNHDWYDGLHGFMRHFCDATRPRRAPPRETGSLLRRAMIRLLWREAPVPDQRRLARMRAFRGEPGQRSRQPGPYFALDAGPLLLVGIDTGITGHLDRAQGEWLQRVSRAHAKPKILLSGTPLYANAVHHPVPIRGMDRTVDDIVRDPDHNYVAAIGGNWHNYQRYPVQVDGGPTVQYIVSGGGGAFMHDTHRIPRVDLPGVSEGDFRCYPLRGDSLSILSRTYQRKLGWLIGNVSLTPEEAAAVLAEERGAPPVREGARETTANAATRRAYRKITRLPRRLPGPLQEYVRRFFDRDDPPLFKSFLRVDANADEIAIRCYAATGCREHEIDPPLEDVARCVRGADGIWHWGSA